MNNANTNMTTGYRTADQMIEAVQSAKENLDTYGGELTPEYMVYWTDVSLKFAKAMIQRWEGRQIDIAKKAAAAEFIRNQFGPDAI